MLFLTAESRVTLWVTKSCPATSGSSAGSLCQLRKMPYGYPTNPAGDCQHLWLLAQLFGHRRCLKRGVICVRSPVHWDQQDSCPWGGHPTDGSRRSKRNPVLLLCFLERPKPWHQRAPQGIRHIRSIGAWLCTSETALRHSVPVQFLLQLGPGKDHLMWPLSSSSGVAISLRTGTAELRGHFRWDRGQRTAPGFSQRMGTDSDISAVTYGDTSGCYLHFAEIWHVGWPTPVTSPPPLETGRCDPAACSKASQPPWPACPADSSGGEALRRRAGTLVKRAI